MEAKAQTFATFVEKHNVNSTDATKHWNVTTVTRNERTTTEASRGDETIKLVWNGAGEVYDYPRSEYSRQDQTWAIRNVSEARKIVTGLVVKGTSTGTKREASRVRTVTSSKMSTDQADDVSASKGKGKRAKSTPDDTETDENAIPKPNLPFKLDDPDDVLRQVFANRTIIYKQGAVRMTKKVEDNNHLRFSISPTNNRRLIHFAGDKFWAIYIDIIEKVM